MKPIAHRLVVAVSLIAAMTAAFVNGPVRAAGPAGDWPTYLRDTSRTADNGAETIVSTATAPQLIKLWSFPTNGFVAPSATVVGDVAYVGSWDGNFFAIDAASGTQKWSKFLGQSVTNCFSPAGISSAAAVVNGIVYVGGGDAKLYALDSSNGAILWSVSAGDNSAASGHYLFSSPLIYNGYAYIGVSSFCDNPLVQGQLLQVSLSTHTIVHTFNVVPNGQVGGGVWTSPSVDPATNTIFITTGNENDASQQYARSIIALDADSLTVTSHWQSPASPTVPDLDWGTTPLLFDDPSSNHRVAATNKNGIVYAFDRNNLAAGPVWQRQIARAGPDPESGDSSASSAAYGGGRLYVAGGGTTINSVSFGGNVRALDPATGNVLWQKGTAGIVLPALAYANGVVFDGQGSTFEARDASSGAVLYNYVTGGALWGAPSISNGRVFTGSTDDSEYAFSLNPTIDSDGDGCPNVNELSPDPVTGGGGRSTSSPWDFFDVPVPPLRASDASGTRNHVVTLADTIGILFYVGTADGGAPNANGVSYNTDVNHNGVPDGREYDRTGSTDSSRMWLSNPPNGSVSIADAIVSLAQVGDNCSVPP